MQKLRDGLKKMFYWKNLKYLFTPLPEPTIIKEQIVLPREDLKERIRTLESSVKSLIAREEELLSMLGAEEHPQKKYWDEKHEERMINYNARNIPYTNTRIKMDVRTFITPEDVTVRRWAKRHDGLKCDNPLKYDSKIRDFFLADRKDFKYEYDINTSDGGAEEVWLFPFELDEAERGDCEDHAHRMKSRLNALGLPDWRSRIVCGLTRDGYGHSTVYYLADDLKTWVHLNSTTPASLIRKSLPTINDDSDGEGIEDVWFSFNKEKSWANFAIPGEGTKRFKYVDVL